MMMAMIVEQLVERMTGRVTEDIFGKSLSSAALSTTDPTW
jgi:hypothetical protein